MEKSILGIKKAKDEVIKQNKKTNPKKPKKISSEFINRLILISIAIGIWGIFFNRKNIVVMLMCIELMLLAVNLNFLIFSAYLDDLIGQLFSLLVLTVAAAESAIGLALLVIYHKTRGNIQIEYMNQLKG
mgnify:CR=1 FL=1